MKKVVCAAVVVTMICCLFDTVSFHPTSAGADALVAWYNFDQSTSGTVPDSSEHGNDLQLYGNCSFTSGKSGNALLFDGSSAYAELPDDILSGLDDFTISAWYKITQDRAWQRVFDFGSGTSQYMFYTPKSHLNLPRFAILKESGSMEQILDDNIAAAVGVWKFVAITQEDGVSKLYSNGALVRTLKGCTSPSELTEAVNNYIGKSQFSADPYFAGAIDEFRIYSRALSQKEILCVMNHGLDDSEAVSNVKKVITVENAGAVRSDISLLTMDLDGLSVRWSSDKPETVSETGKVNRPSNGSVQVNLTATIKKGTVTDTKEFAVTVLGEDMSDYTFDIYSEQRGADINPNMFGLFFEDINYGADGGLYGELVENRSFECYRFNQKAYDPGYAWTPVMEGGAALSVLYNTTAPLHENNPHYMSLVATKLGTGVGIYNKCYEGVAGKKGDKFNFSMFVKAKAYTSGFRISLEKDGNVYAKAVIDGGYTKNQWSKVSCTMTAESDFRGAKLYIRLLDIGSLDVDMVSLFPQNTWYNRENGLRADLVQKLKDLCPGFLRFPGGCIVEGYNLDNRYRWKDTVGRVEERKSNWNRWQEHTNNFKDYNQSYGLGFFEYFLLCEDIGAEPLPVLNCGMACQYQTGELVPMEELEEYINDALDLVEFANGSVDTKWGALRAEMGHPEPFNLKYIAIGNEQWGTEYFKRYEAFQMAFAEKYPEIKLISTSGPSASGKNFDLAWNWLSDKGRSFAYAVDEHYYMSPDWFFSNTNRYDLYDRTGPMVFAGEYAAHDSSNSKANNMLAALSEAAFMTGLERNADVVHFASYAPLFARLNYTQWTPDLIWFNDKDSFVTPNYYVQKMYSTNVGTYTLPGKLTARSFTPQSGKAGVGTWQTTAVFDDFKIINNADSSVLFEDSFDTDTGAWSGTGTWSREGGELVQSSTDVDVRYTVGDTSWNNYTITLRAKKTGGNEGFFIPFLVQDENNYYVWNIGGWRNTATAVERCKNGSKSTVSKSVPAAVETGRWYDLKIEVKENIVNCYLDGELVNEVSINNNEGPVYMNSVFDENTGDIIIKMVNSSVAPKEAKINLNRSGYVNPLANITELSADDLTAVNTIENKDNVAPVEKVFDKVANSFKYTLPAYSFTVMRIHTKPDSEVISRIPAISVEVKQGSELELPETVLAEYNDGHTEEVEVTWDKLPEGITRVTGRFGVDGRVPGTNLLAKVYADVREMPDFEVSASANLPSLESNKTLTASVSVSSNAEYDAKVLGAVALYDESGNLKKVSAVNKHVSAGEAADLSISLDLPEIKNGDKAKIYVWKVWNTEACLTPILEKPIEIE